jgi:hypothetical protein
MVTDISTLKESLAQRPQSAQRKKCKSSVIEPYERVHPPVTAEVGGPMAAGCQVNDVQTS